MSNVSYFLDLSSCLLYPSGQGYDESRMLGHRHRLYCYLWSPEWRLPCAQEEYFLIVGDFFSPTMEHKVLLSLFEDLGDISLVPVIRNDQIIV